MLRRLRPLLYSAGALILFARPSQAQYKVTNTSDSGAGSLRSEITASNGAGGTNTISWSGAASGGTINLGSALPSSGGINNNTTLDVTNAASAVTIAGSPMVLGNAGGDNVTFHNGTPSLAWTISAPLSGVGSLTATGLGTLFLTGANTYSGGTSINAGILNINNDDALGNSSGGLTFNNGILQTAANINSSRNVTLNLGGGIINTQSSTSTFSGPVSGSGALTVTGNGVLKLTNAGNNYSGGTFLLGGILNINNDAVLGALGSTTTFNGGMLQAGTNITSSRYMALNGSGGTFDTNGFASTLSGVISGAGGLNVIGTSAGLGSLALTANNTFTGTIRVSSATLIISSDTALGSSTGVLYLNAATIQSAAGANLSDLRTVYLYPLGGTFDTNGSSSTWAGIFEGAGALTKTGSNTLYLTGINTYTGGTNLNAGTININNNSGLGTGVLNFNGGTLQAGAPILSVGVPVTLNAGGGTVDANGNKLTLTGAISGTGGLTIMSTAYSTGTVVLNGGNTYSGGTFLNSGILNIAFNEYLGVSTGTVTFNGGTLQAGAAFSSARNMIIGSSSGTIDTNTYNLYLSGVISGGSGANGLTKMGAGALVLSGANTYGGSTSVNAGSLQLGANNSLPTGQDITVNSGAYFNILNFTQTVKNYNPTGGGGTLIMLLQPGVSPNLNVTGNANIANDTLAVGFNSSISTSIANGQQFKPIRAGTFSVNPITNGFANIISPAAFSFLQSIQGNNLVLTTQYVPFANIAANSNQIAVGNSIEPLRTNPTGDVATVIGNLYTLDTSSLQSALDQISPVALASMQILGLSGSTVQFAALSQRMAALDDGAPHAGLSSYTVNGRSRQPSDLLASAGFNDSDYWQQSNSSSSNGSGSSSSQSPWGFFTSGVGTAGRLQEASSDSGLQPGFAFNTAGITGGADYRITDNLAAGASFGYLHGHASIYAPGSGTVDNNSARYGVYGATFGEGWRANIYLGGASDFFQTNRGINFAGISRTATASPTGNEFDVHSNASYDFKTNNWGILSPFVGVDYDRMMIGSFMENGADSLDLSVSPQTAQSLESSLGAKLSEKFTGDWFTWTPFGSLGWRHQFIDQSRPIDAQVAAGGGTPFTVMTGGYARDGTLVSLGFTFTWNETTSAKFDYTGDFRSHYQDNEFNAGVRWKF